MFERILQNVVEEIVHMLEPLCQLDSRNLAHYTSWSLTSLLKSQELWSFYVLQKIRLKIEQDLSAQTCAHSLRETVRPGCFMTTAKYPAVLRDRLRPLTEKLDWRTKCWRKGKVETLHSGFLERNQQLTSTSANLQRPKSAHILWTKDDEDVCRNFHYWRPAGEKKPFVQTHLSQSNKINVPASRPPWPGTYPWNPKLWL